MYCTNRNQINVISKREREVEGDSDKTRIVWIIFLFKNFFLRKRWKRKMECLSIYLSIICTCLPVSLLDGLQAYSTSLKLTSLCPHLCSVKKEQFSTLLLSFSTLHTNLIHLMRLTSPFFLLSLNTKWLHCTWLTDICLASSSEILISFNNCFIESVQLFPGQSRHLAPSTIWLQCFFTILTFALHSIFSHHLSRRLEIQS